MKEEKGREGKDVYTLVDGEREERETRTVRFCKKPRSKHRSKNLWEKTKRIRNK